MRIRSANRSHVGSGDEEDIASPMMRGAGRDTISIRSGRNTHLSQTSMGILYPNYDQVRTKSPIATIPK